MSSKIVLIDQSWQALVTLSDNEKAALKKGDSHIRIGQNGTVRIERNRWGCLGRLFNLIIGKKPIDEKSAHIFFETINKKIDLEINQEKSEFQCSKNSYRQLFMPTNQTKEILAAMKLFEEFAPKEKDAFLLTNEENEKLKLEKSEFEKLNNVIGGQKPITYFSFLLDQLCQLTGSKNSIKKEISKAEEILKEISQKSEEIKKVNDFFRCYKQKNPDDFTSQDEYKLTSLTKQEVQDKIKILNQKIASAKEEIKWDKIEEHQEKFKNMNSQNLMKIFKEVEKDLLNHVDTREEIIREVTSKAIKFIHSMIDSTNEPDQLINIYTDLKIIFNTTLGKSIFSNELQEKVLINLKIKIQSRLNSLQPEPASFNSIQQLLKIYSLLNKQIELFTKDENSKILKNIAEIIKKQLTSELLNKIEIIINSLNAQDEKSAQTLRDTNTISKLLFFVEPKNELAGRLHQLQAQLPSPLPPSLSLHLPFWADSDTAIEDMKSFTKSFFMPFRDPANHAKLMEAAPFLEQFRDKFSYLYEQPDDPKITQMAAQFYLLCALDEFYEKSMHLILNSAETIRTFPASYFSKKQLIDSLKSAIKRDFPKEELSLFEPDNLDKAYKAKEIYYYQNNDSEGFSFCFFDSIKASS